MAREGSGQSYFRNGTNDIFTWPYDENCTNEESSVNCCKTYNLKHLEDG